jgi:GNAT superfamily N-acetyltransferase
LSSLEELAEDIEALLPLPDSAERVELPDCVLVAWPWIAPPAAAVHRLRFVDDAVEQRIADVRAWFRERGRERFTWWVGDSATPQNLAERLQSAGAEPWEDEPLIATMLTTEPPPTVDGVQVVLATTYEQFALAQEISWEAMGRPEEQRVQGRDRLEARWQECRRQAEEATFLALIDGRPVASGSMLFCPFAGFLSGAATLPDARGQGVFRALVRARWEEAERRGTPSLIVGAGAMSRPILERIGFRVVAETQVLVDASGVSN